MKYILLLLYCCFTISVLGQMTPKSISLDIQNETLQATLETLQSDYEIYFSYQNESMTDYRVTCKIVSASLEEALQVLLKNTSLSYKIVDDNFVLIQAKPEADFPRIELCGFVKDELTKESLAFANIYVSEIAGTTSAEDGSFKFSGSFSPNQNIQISYLGYQSKQLNISDLVDENCPTIYLTLNTQTIEGITITEYLTDGISTTTDNSAVILEPEKLLAPPGFVEADVMQNVQLLPGVSSPDESAEGIHIRGGTPDQNLILWNAIPIYSSAHYFGMISAFNPNILDAVKVWRSGFGAEYGGRVSGIIDMSTEKTIPEKVEVGVGLNLTHHQAYVHTPLFNQKSSFLISYRRSFSDVILSPTFRRLREQVFQSSYFDEIPEGEQEDFSALESFHFNEWNIQWQYELSQQERLSVSAFWDDNQYAYQYEEDPIEENIASNIQHQGMSVQWEKFYEKQWSSHVNASFSKYRASDVFELFTDSAQLVLEDYNRSNIIDDFTANFLQKWQPSTTHHFEAGAQYSWQQAGFEINETIEADTIINSDNINSSHTIALFGTYKYQSERWFISLGSRYHFYQPLTQHFFEPRLSVQYHFDDYFSAKAGYNRSHQFISQLVSFRDGTLLGLAEKTWVLANDDENNEYDVFPIQANQVTAGLAFRKNKWLIDIEAYYKNLSDITAFYTNFDNTFESDFRTGFSTVRGIDFLIKKRWKNYRTWASYTLSKTDYFFEEIHETYFPASHDQRHQLKWMHTFNWKQWHASLAWRYSSGKPFTDLIDIEEEYIVEEEDEDEGFWIERGIIRQPNNERLNDYHRLDFSLFYHFKPSPNKTFQGKIGLSIINLYQQTNELGVFYRLTEEEEELQEDPFFALERSNREGLGFTPNLSVILRW